MQEEQLPSKEQVLQQIFSLWRPVRKTESIPVSEAAGRIPAERVFSRISLPVVRASMMDGIAVNATRFHNGLPDTREWRPGVDYAQADTGDDFDDAFDAVIRIEDVRFTDQGLTLPEDLTVVKGQNIRPAGSQISKGDLLVEKHMPLLPKDLAMLLMGDVREIPVLRRPVVSFIFTGSELVSPGTPVARGQYIETNGLFVKESLTPLGAETQCGPIVPDKYEQIAEALDSVFHEADIIVLTGGSSKGQEDLSAKLLKERGQVICHGAAAAPGRPICIALIDGKLVINLPGPLVAAYYGMEWCLNGVVSHFLHQPMRQRQKVKAILTDDIQGPETISFLYKIDLSRDANGGLLACPLNIRKVSTSSFILANAQYMTRLGGEFLPKGSEIEVELLRGLEYIV